MNNPEITTKKKRGRPPGAKTQVSASTLNPASDDDESEDPTKRQRNENSDDDEEHSDDMILAEFRGGPQVSHLTIPKPDFGDEKHMWFMTTQVSHMATLFKTLSNFFSKANVVFGNKGWRIAAVNSLNNAFISLRITEQTMAAGLYECNTNYRIRIPVDELAQRLRMCRRAEVMCMELRGDNPKTLHLQFSQENRITEMDLMLCTPDDQDFEPPTVVYHSQVDLPADQLREVVNSYKADNMIRNITFTKSPNKFTVTVNPAAGSISTHFAPSGDESVRFMKRTGDNDAFEFTNEGESETTSGTFNLKQIIDFSGVTKASKWVRINMPEKTPVETPLRMSYSLAALGEISFLLAGEIVDNDDEPSVDHNDE